ncbi:spore photoproduct lyase [Hazenella sp. IB182357]|uniref:Spore photoproduct lyase n=1 Tax=Polycladospora coralii TaxID=2771432 RepID=A0A926RTJ2_9BACL|nr:spore photoproduct lyase [Polycladospora coralii]MBD1371773.1 spore photoproduct lyase [Polycladospora coralii]MBS7529234.1 spore photoproduct lyase [Polycladospora coralii]
MKPFQPDLVFFEPDSLNYPLGKKLYQQFKEQRVEVRMTTSHNRVTGIPGENDLEKYRVAKRTLVVGIRKTLKFETSKPSAEYAIPLATGCMGHCHYCYLQTTMGNRPYIRVYVNLDEIFAAAKHYIAEREPEITHFEAACTSDPVGLEHITGSLKQAIEFFGQEPLGRLRFVTKFHTVDGLLDAQHNGHTRIRFSINADTVIRQYEPATARLDERIEAATKVAYSKYPIGFIIAPLMIFDGWEAEYDDLLFRLRQSLPVDLPPPHFELISHRFTKTAKRVIEERYPKTKLEMDEEKRKKKWGKYGRVKYIYQDEERNALKSHMEERIHHHFPNAEIDYFT